MIVINEKPSIKLPNLTSLFFKLPFINKHLEESLAQQQIYYYDKSSCMYELPITRLFYLINTFIQYDDVIFKPFKKPSIKYKKIPNEIKFKVKPYSYQLEGIEFGLNHNGWLLLDDQGLGKTLQMIYLAEVLHQTEHIEHCLIICGVNGLKYNWEAEIKKFSKLSCTILGQKISKAGKRSISSVKDRCTILKNPIKEFFIITNIETLQNKEFAEAFKKSKNKFGMVVVDEAHKSKNPDSKAAKCLLKLTSPHNIALSGTLIMNNPENAYLPLKWTGNLKCTYGMFKNMYNVYGGFGGVQVIGYKNLDLLQAHLSECSLRRLKTDVLDLPEKTYQIEYVEMGAQQRDLYASVAKGISEELDLLSKRSKISLMQEMVMNMRLRQITAWPGVLSTNVNESAKLDRLEELVETITAQGDKIVVFCSFKSTVPEIKRRLSTYNPLICTGDQSDEDINTNKQLFQEDETHKVLVATWQKFGTGVTLTRANYVIFVDTPWTDADFQQCADRIYRIGQTKHSFIITLVTKDTYDERVLEILERKESLSGYVIDKKDSTLLHQIKDFDL